MLQDLLLALYGVPGAIFIESSASGKAVSNTFDAETELVLSNDNFPFVSQGELCLHAELVKLGGCYRSLEKFIRRHAGPHHSLYLSALACGLDDALNDYRQALVVLESELLADPDLNVAHIAYRLHSYKFVLPILAELTRRVECLNTHSNQRQNASGCRLLDVLMLAAPPGLPGPRVVIQKLIKHTMRVFYRQLYSWLICGVLHDPYNEFFVQRHDVSQSERSEVASNSHPDDTVHALEWTEYSSYTLAVDYIPSFLPTSFAQHVLFSGEAINLTMRGPSQSSLLKDLESEFGNQFADLLLTLQTDHSVAVADQNPGVDVAAGIEALFDISPLQNLVSEIRAFVSHRIWNDLVHKHNVLTHLRSVKDVALLGRGELFLAFIDQLNALSGFEVKCSTDSQNSSKPIAFSSQPLFGRGLLDRPVPVDTSEIQAIEYDIQAAFLSAARSIGLDDDELDDQFRFSISSEPLDTEAVPKEDQTLWDRLQLHIHVPPELRLIFSKQVCRGYDRLFRYLTTVRRTQLMLQQYWAEQTLVWRSACAPSLFGASGGIRSAEQFGLDPKIDFAKFQASTDRRLLMRNYMAFFIENLQYYLQVDVIESQFCHLIRRIQSDKEADLVLVAHEAYLAGLQAQALLFHPTAKPCILRLLSVCRQIVSVARISGSSGRQHLELSDLEEQLLSEFKKLAGTLFHCLNSSQTTGAVSGVGLEFDSRCFDQPFRAQAGLSQLLLRLDFNQFFSDSRRTRPAGSQFDGT
ncbi:Gamma-tubulin complex component [Paragonimus heterotremus]|uniref:Gamma-tubulin complex component n=1 Tax=Paragonimus heterotremus TaxID=100268 RepID=A0A8J4WSU6_9TREM|nr:Gamma-tubulin complex component [Paragonimus heterotremus]